MGKVNRWFLVASLMVSMLMAGAVAVKAATLEVGPEGYPYTSIQTAINDAAPGDVVLVHDGSYFENINFNGKAITVRSENGANTTTIDGSDLDSVVIFDSSEGSSSVLEGFTISRGANIEGGGIFCNGSSPIINNCIITGNWAEIAGGGISCVISSATITNCTISGNDGGLYGGGIDSWNSSPSIINTVISNNWVLMGGGGIASEFTSSPSVTNCTISGNSGGIGGGGILCSDSTITVVNSILWGDTAMGGNPDEIDGEASISYSDIEGGYFGTGNIVADPLLLFPLGGNCRLQSGSPCIDAANSDNPAPATDVEGNARYDDPNTNNTGTGSNGSYYDMGAYEYTGAECVDSDGDGYYSEAGCGTEVDCNDGNWRTYPGADERCDGVDNDCDGAIDEESIDIFYADLDHDGFGDDNNTTQTCPPPPGYLIRFGDCNDNDPNIHPKATELCDNLDNDCDGNIDENLIQSCGSDVGECQSGTQTCSAGSWGTCVGEIGPSPEICDDLDNNCNGSIDEGLTQNCGSDVGECQSGTQTCSAGSWGTCVGEIGPSPEVCDNLDNNCDGNIDEGLPLNDYYLDGDGDTYGDPNNSIQYCGSAPGGYVSDNTDCDDSNPNINPAACDIKRNGIDEDCDGSDRQSGPACSGGGNPEICDDGIDNDGDGDIDCADSDCTGDPACSGGCVPSAEICDDGIDNDCDGKTDCADNKDCKNFPGC